MGNNKKVKSIGHFKKMNQIINNFNLGILMMISSSFFLSLMAILVKSLRGFPIMEITFFRNLPTIVIVTIMLRSKKISIFGKNQNLLFVRSFFGITSQIGYFYTCTILVLSDAMAIRQLAPIFIFIFSVIFLEEKYKYKQFLIFLTSFLGALFIIKPGIRINFFPVFIGISSAILLSGSYVTVRELRKSEHALVIVNHLSWCVGIFSLIGLGITRQFVLPNFKNYIKFLFLGLLGLGSQFTLTKAYQVVPASLVSLYMYTQIIFSFILDYFIFSDILDLYSFFGTSLIIFSGYLNYHYRLKSH